jgi:triphosphoribosyl-dephospho-CoA synthetase
MSFLLVHAYLQLFSFGFYLKQRSFAELCAKVHNYPLSTQASTSDDVKQICSAVDKACIWYWKRALCLQRSAATACLLRRYGAKAQMVIGSRPIPFRAHAWVEVEGRVVNDKSDVQKNYVVLERC